MKKFFALAVFFAITSTSYAAGGSGASQGSADLSSQGLSQIVGGSGTILSQGSELVVVSVQTVGQFIHLTLRSLYDSTTMTLEISTKAIGGVSLAAGQTIQVVSTAAGYMLQASGNVIAFLPTELGKSLIYSTQF